MLIFICDDDPLVIKKTKKYLETFFRKAKLKQLRIMEFSCGEDALRCSHVPDIAFLDIEMEGISGIKTGELLRKKNRDVIIFILTSFSEYLDEAMKINVFRYLSKPLEKERLYRNLQEAISTYHATSGMVELETKGMTFIIKKSDIVCIESDRHYSIVHLKNKDIESVKTIKYWLEQLTEPCFYQPHRSFIVNLSHVSDYDTCEIRFSDSSCKAYMARRKYTEFKQRMMLYLEGSK